MWVVYFIQNSISQKLYIGLTQNLQRRIKEHNSNGKKYTTKNGKWVLIYAEAYRDKKDAYLREQRLKSHARGKQELLKRLTNSLLETRIGEGRS